MKQETLVDGPAGIQTQVRSLFPTEVAMVADMHRLEQAARLSMGDFEGSQKPAAPVRRSPLPMRIAGVALLLLLVLGAASQFL